MSVARKVTLAIFIIAILWSGARFTLLALNYSGEVSSLVYFQFTIVNVEMQDNETMLVEIRFENPTSWDVRILSISGSIKGRVPTIIPEYGQYIILGFGVKSFYSTPLIVEKGSELTEELSIDVYRRFHDYVGEEVQIDASVVIETEYHGRIKRTVTYPWTA